jgi:hypothetical protein
LTHVLVQQHPDQQREGVTAEQLIGGGVLGDSEGRHVEIMPCRRSSRPCYAFPPGPRRQVG